MHSDELKNEEDDVNVMIDEIHVEVDDLYGREKKRKSACTSVGVLPIDRVRNKEKCSRLCIYLFCCLLFYTFLCINFMQ